MAQRQLYSGLDLYDWRGTGPNGRTKAVDVDKWQQNQEDIRHLPGAFPVQSVVITDGQITPTAAALSVDTEGGAPADDLTAIAPGDLHAGMLLALCSVDAGRKVTIKNSAGASGIQTLDGKDVVLDTQYAVMLRLVSTESLSLWREEPGPLRLGLTVSSPDTLGGVKVQTGDDDGLEMTGGELRVRKASTTQRGSVLASETAAAGAVPVGGTDGTLGEDWLKLAMDAAAAAQQAAEVAQEVANNAQSDATKALSPAKKLGTRAGNTDSQWTLTNLTPGRLLVLLVDSTEPDDTETFIVFLSGTVTSNSERVTDYNYSIRLGKPSGTHYFDPYSTVDIITNKTVVIKIFSGRANSKVSAYEV